MLKIAIVEDEKIQSDQLLSYLEKYCSDNNILYNASTFSNPLSLLENYSSDYHIIFLDIMMPYMNGMEAAHKIREVDNNALIIFVTNLAQYAIAGYEVNALDYVLKPMRYNEFALKMQKALSRINLDDDKSIRIATKEGKVNLEIKDIIYIEVQGHRVNYHTNRGDFIERNSIREIEKDLTPYGFSRCNNCYLVNMRYVTLIKGYSVFLGETELQISQPRKKAFNQALVEFWEGK